MVRGRDACWEHCVLVDATRQKVRCNYCHREFSGGVYRMKFHLAQIKNKDIVPCTEVPNDVRNLIQNILSTPKKQKVLKRQREVDRQQNGPQDSSSDSGGFNPNHISSERNGSTCPSLPIPRPSLTVQAPLDDLQKQKYEDADKKVASFFIHNSLPFSASKSVYYQTMVDAIAECGAGYKAPSYEQLRSNLLDKLKGDINDSYKKFQEEWVDVGCTILSDCWSDGCGVSLVVFSVTCPRGTIFLKSIDVSSHVDDPHYLFGLLESVVMEVGLENVVQVITGGAASYVYAGRLLTAKYPSVFCMPCASCCIDKMLEDISRHEWVNLVLEEAKTITKYIYGHAWLSNLMRKFTCGADIVRPRIRRFASYFLSLRVIVVQEDNLKHMFSHAEYLSSAYSRRSDAQAVKSLLYLDRFWKLAHEAVGVTEPLLKVLRIVDGDIPAMGYVYEGMEKAKVVIKAFYKGVEEKYLPIWDIIDRRWNVQHHSPLYAAAAFLNPFIFYNAHFKIDLKVRNGFQDAMLKMLTEDKDKIELTKEHPMYINAQGALGTDFAILGRALNSPGKRNCLHIFIWSQHIFVLLMSHSTSLLVLV